MSNTADLREQSESTDQAIGRRVHQLMWDRRLTNVAFARSIGVDPTGLSRRLRGDRGWGSDEILAAARELSVPVGVLFGEDEMPTPGGPNLPEKD